MVKQVAGHLVIDVHDLTDFFITTILIVFQVDNLLLPARELFQCAQKEAFSFRLFFSGDQEMFVAEFEPAVAVSRGQGDPRLSVNL